MCKYELPEGVEVLDVKYRETGYDTSFAGSFACDDPMLTRLWNKAQRTLYITRNTFMCGKRIPWDWSYLVPADGHGVTGERTRT